MMSMTLRKPGWVEKGARTLALWLLAVLVASSAGVLLLAAKPAHAVTTFTVNNTFDPGNGVCDAIGCTLREAIDAANATPNSGGPDRIRFAITGDGPHTITPSTALPIITEAVIVDGYTQGSNTSGTSDDAKPNALATGNNAVLKIELNGANAPSGTIGVRIETSNSVVRGLVINRFGGPGIYIFGTANKVEGNFVGTDSSGTQNLFGNGENGVYVREGSNTVGGTSPAARNLISGNGHSGVFIDVGSTGTEVLGNFIGTNVNGTQALGNTFNGVSVGAGSGNTIGGTSPGARNLISGNGVHGVFINFLVTGSKVQGNFIGTDRTGASDLGNGRSGVQIDSSNSVVGGGISATNTIAFNSEAGIQVGSESASRNRFLHNSIFSNTGLGIELAFDGTTPNDGGTADDADTGPNGLQNKPQLSSAVTSGGTTTIRGVLDSKPDTTYNVQFFRQPTGNEGKTFIGQKSVPTDADGRVTFSISPASAVAVGQKITATATGPEGTSEFSAPREVTAS